jgi:hypothetical protein
VPGGVVPPYEVAIDPISLILSGKAYLIWVEKNFPHVPKVAEILATLRAMTAEEQNAALNRARTVVTYAKAVEEAIAAIGRTRVTRDDHTPV